MHWVVAAPFITQSAEQGWLTRYVPREKHDFTLVPAPARTGEWHKRSSKTTDSQEWGIIWKHAKLALREAHGGIITHFPQLAAAVGLRRRFLRVRRPHLAWSFNLGQMYGGLKGRLARIALGKVDRFVVHSRREIEQYGTWLKLPRERFEFVPIQRADIPVQYEEERTDPFVLAMGSAGRDYPTFLAAVAKLKLPTIVVVAPHSIDGAQIPANVTVKSGLTFAQCHELAQKVRVNIVPIANEQTASGQVTVVEAMTMGRPLIATRCMGTEDYVEGEKTGILVEPRSTEALADSIARLWNDEPLRLRLGAGAREYARTHFSNEAVAKELVRILDALQ